VYCIVVWRGVGLLVALEKNKRHNLFFDIAMICFNFLLNEAVIVFVFLRVFLEFLNNYLFDTFHIVQIVLY